MAKLILLDRDGVINFDSPEYIKDPGEWRPLPGSVNAIVHLRSAGYLVDICSNQAGVARGKLSGADLDAIDAKMANVLSASGTRLNAVHYCPHQPSDACECRKPQPGMLLAAMQELGIPAEETLFVGDSLRDVQAALAAHCQPVLVRTGNGRRAERATTMPAQLPVYDDLAQFVAALLS